MASDEVTSHLDVTTPVITERYHGLDGLRGFAMLLGIVVHATLPYFSRAYGLEGWWPADDDHSDVLLLLFALIHTWRMPVFFLLAGFFANLMLEHRSTKDFILDRLRRILVPLLVFGTVMAISIPVIWVYGWYGIFTLEGISEGLLSTDYLTGNPVGHLWFLYYLLLMYTVLIGLRLLARSWKLNSPLQFGKHTLSTRLFGNLIYTPVPVVLILAAVTILIFRLGDETKPIWPLNVPDVLYGAIFFFYGYGLYERRQLIDKFKESKWLIILLTLAIISFLANLILIGDAGSPDTEDSSKAGSLWFLALVAYGAAAGLFSVGLVGLFERFLRAHRHSMRLLADSSYWIYLIHLPIVTLLTFYLAHLDRRGWLSSFTGMNWSAEAKFLVACFVTGIIGIVTYRYLIRYTLIGAFLGRKSARVPSEKI